MSAARRVLTTISALLLAVTFLGGCSSVPARSDPAPASPGTPQKTITELRTQTVDLLNDAITATGIPNGWLWSTVPPQVAWDSDIDKTRLESCWTVGAKDSNQITAVVYHQPTGEPHSVAKILAEHWKSLGFTVKTVIDWAKGEYVEVEIAADRADGANYDLSVSTHNMSIQAWSECSTDTSFQAWIDGWIDREYPQKATPTP